MKKGNKNRLVAILAMSAFLILLVVDMCLMIRMPEEYMIQNVLILCALIAASLFSCALLKEIIDDKENTAERYESLERSGKANYIMLKRLNERLGAVESRGAEDKEQKKGEPEKQISEENIINAQKAAVRVIVSRNQEDAREIINSNTKVLEDVNAVGERIDDFKSELLAMEKSVFEMMRQDINDQREEQLREQKDIMDEILNQLDTAKEEILISQVQIENTYKEIMQTGYSRQDETHQDMEMTLDDVESHKGQVDAAGDDSEIPYIGDEVPRESENLLGESENLLGESENLLEQEDTTDENNVGAIDELPGLYMEDLPDLEGSDDTAEEPNESLVLEETAVETKQETSDEEQEEEFTEGLGDLEEVEVIDQPLTDEKDTDEEEYTQDDQSMLEGLAMLNEIQNLDNDEEKQNDMEKEPDFSNPNKMMTADEIAALLENM